MRLELRPPIGRTNDATQPPPKTKDKTPGDRFRTRMRRRIAVLSVVVFAALGVGTVATAVPAYAYSYGWVYLVFPTWLGNCPGGGNVTWIKAAVGPHDDVWSGGDGGDDIIYPEVALNQWNSVDAEVFCSNGYGSYYNYVHSNFYPVRNNEAIWVGSAGWTHN